MGAVFSSSSPQNLHNACPPIPFHSILWGLQECPRPIEENGKLYPFPVEEMNEMVSVIFRLGFTTGELDSTESQSQIIQYNIW